MQKGPSPRTQRFLPNINGSGGSRKNKLWGGESLERPSSAAVKEEEEETDDVVEPPPMMSSSFQQETDDTSSTVVSLFSNKNFWIAMLVVLLILSFLGVNLVMLLGQIFQPIVNVFWILISQILSLFGYTTGTVLNKTVDVVSGTAKAGIDIAEGTVQSVGNLLIKGSSQDVPPVTQAQIASNILGPAPAPGPGTAPATAAVGVGAQTTTTTTTIQQVAPSTLDQVLNRAHVVQAQEPKPDLSTSNIQTSSTWCFVGEMNGKRTCADVSSSNLCLSGQVYKTQSECQSIEGFTNGPLMMSTPPPPPTAAIQSAPTGAIVVQLPSLGPPQYMGPPNFPPPGMTQMQLIPAAVPSVGEPILGVGPPNYITMGSQER